MNYFALLKLEANFNIDKNLLKQSYLDQQAQNHPDLANSNKEKVNLIDKSALINKAYNTLIDDYSRSEYILQLKGYDFSELVNKNILSEDELDEIWILNDTLENINNLNELHEFENTILKRTKSIISDISKFYDNNEMSNALAFTIKLKYFKNLLKNARTEIKNMNLK